MMACGAWDFPMCQAEKTRRLIQLFEAEVLQAHGDVDALQGEIDGLRTKSTWRSRTRRSSAPDSCCKSTSSAHCGDDESVPEASAAASSVSGFDSKAFNGQVLALHRELQHVQKRNVELERQRESNAQDYKRMRTLMMSQRSEFEKSQEEVDRQRKDNTQLQTSLALLREFGNENFMNRRSQDIHDIFASKRPLLRRRMTIGCKPAPPPEEPPDGDGQREDVVPAGDAPAAVISSVLIAVDVELGAERHAMLTVAPWQTRADFQEVVQAFCKEHRVRPIFAAALVQYLGEVEKAAEAFPITVQANLADVYSSYG
jgi:hypothetical protein